MKVRKSLVKDVEQSIDTLITKLRETSRWFQLVIDDLYSQSTYVNSAKTFNATVSVISAAMLFSGPLAPFGIAGLAISGVGSAATAAGDYWATSSKGKVSRDKFKEIQNEEKKLVKYLKELDQVIKEISKKHKVNEEAAWVILLRYLMPTTTSVTAGTNATIDIARVAPHVVATVSTMQRSSATLMQAARLAQVVNTMSRSASVMQGAQGAAAGLGAAGSMTSVTSTVSLASKILGPLGAGASVGDAVLSWATTNPSQAEAQQFKEGIDKMITKYENMKESIEAI